MKVYDKKSAACNSGQLLAVSFNRNGRLIISAGLIRKWGITPGCGIVLAQSGEGKKPRFYIAPSDDPAAFRVTKSRGGGCNCHCQVQTIQTANDALDAAGLDDIYSAKFPVAHDPTVIDGQDWWQIDLRCPLRKGRSLL